MSSRSRAARGSEWSQTSKRREFRSAVLVRLTVAGACCTFHNSLLWDRYREVAAMPRRRRELIEGGLYHVCNRFARGEPIFGDPEEAIAFVDRLREVKARDGLSIHAWCVMSNHYRKGAEGCQKGARHFIRYCELCSAAALATARSSPELRGFPETPRPRTAGGCPGQEPG